MVLIPVVWSLFDIKTSRVIWNTNNLVKKSWDHGMQQKTLKKKTQYPFLTLPRSQRWWDSLTWATCSGSLFHRHHASWCDTECILLGLGSCKRVYSHRSTSLSRFTFPQKRILQRKLWDDSAAKVIMAVRDDDQSSVPRPHLWEESDDSHDISWSPWASVLSSECTHAPSPAHDMIIK